MRKDLLTSIGSLLPSFLIGSCCLGPAIFILFGVSISSLGAFAYFAKYQYIFISIALVFLGFSFYQLYIKKPSTETTCTTGTCEIKGHSTKKINKVFFWIAVSIFIIAIFYPYILVKVL